MGVQNTKAKTSVSVQLGGDEQQGLKTGPMTERYKWRKMASQDTSGSLAG